ncbi:hypothetical protein PsYK624_088720 [Phanerochaete sordida]|uniref:Uncharacterized protein n=1 Tax=Phanerochaete sordida TaxID=48140 RepID=A0A9P3GDD3_9APHY|nr:hypothetical protein PsYK624_088720 [Phanerochaete sordida]
MRGISSTCKRSIGVAPASGLGWAPGEASCLSLKPAAWGFAKSDVHTPLVFQLPGDPCVAVVGDKARDFTELE